MSGEENKALVHWEIVEVMTLRGELPRAVQS
jgi:hypothetical protein